MFFWQVINSNYDKSADSCESGKIKDYRFKYCLLLPHPFILATANGVNMMRTVQIIRNTEKGSDYMKQNPS
jgi:hypothetical protein